ncbi:MAG: hypothetical protein ABSE63_14650, partial [Thermoguttaceae bacterium]
PIYENPIFSGLPIKIVNPASSGVTLSYSLNGAVYSIPPGFSQTLVADRLWTIQFSRGAGFGDAQYGLDSGVYTFGSSDHGWELYHSALVDSAPLGGSLNPTPLQSAPVNNPLPGAATVTSPPTAATAIQPPTAATATPPPAATTTTPPTGAATP